MACFVDRKHDIRCHQNHREMIKAEAETTAGWCSVGNLSSKKKPM